MEKIKIVLADDSAIMRGLLQKSFAEFSDIEIIDSVSNGRKAVDVARSSNPDVVITDIDMPELTGIEACKILHDELKIPVIILSENPAQKAEALNAGAECFIEKPDLTNYKKFLFSNLVSEVRRIHSSLKSKIDFSSFSKPAQIIEKFKVLCIGASTGGPSAVKEVLCSLGRNFPLPVLYVQHIDEGSDKKMAAWFKDVCTNLDFKLAEDGETAQQGCVYMAPANRHLVIKSVSANGLPVLSLSDEPEEHFLRPAVNKLFKSAAEKYKGTTLAILLTGMGRDGADGCKEIVDAGGYTIAEDKSTCAVFGMPGAAIEIGGATEVLPRDKIGPRAITLAD